MLSAMRKSPPAPKIGNVAAIERRVRKRGQTVARFLRFADLEFSLWSKWRRNVVTPRAETWNRVLADLARFESQGAA